MLESVKCFSYVNRCAHKLCLLCLVNVVDSTDWFSMLDQFGINGKDPTWSYCIMLFIHHWFGLLKFCQRFWFLCSTEITVYAFLFLYSFIWCWNQSSNGFRKIKWEVYFHKIICSFLEFVIVIVYIQNWVYSWCS